MPSVPWVLLLSVEQSCSFTSLLTTAGGEDYKPKGMQVDAITSASKLEEVGAVAEIVLDKVRTLLGKEMG